MIRPALLFFILGWSVTSIVRLDIASAQQTAPASTADATSPPKAAGKKGKSAKAGPRASQNKTAKGNATTSTDPGTSAVKPFQALDLLLPLNQTAVDVSLPQTDEAGQLTQLTKADTVTRIGDNSLSFVNLRINSYEPAEEGDLVMTLDLDHGVYYRDESPMIVSEGPSKVVRKDFLLVGQALTLLPEEKVAQITGPGYIKFYGDKKAKPADELTPPAAPAPPVAPTPPTQTTKASPILPKGPAKPPVKATPAAKPTATKPAATKAKPAPAKKTDKPRS